jgi:hypothetical protein
LDPRVYKLKVKYVPIIALVGFLAIMSGMPLLSSGIIANNAFARYATNTQTQANSNECITGTNCAITSPQTQGDGTANSPVNTQISEFNEEREGGVGDTDGESCVVRGFCVLTVQPCLRTPFPDIVCFIVQPDGNRIFCSLAGICDIYLTSGIGRSFKCEPAPVESTELQTTTCIR